MTRAPYTPAVGDMVFALRSGVIHNIGRVDSVDLSTCTARIEPVDNPGIRPRYLFVELRPYPTQET